MHAALGALLLLLHREASPSARGTATTAIELVDIASTTDASVPVAETEPMAGREARGTSSGSVDTRDTGSTNGEKTTPTREASARGRAADIDPRGAISVERAQGGNRDRTIGGDLGCDGIGSVVVGGGCGPGGCDGVGDGIGTRGERGCEGTGGGFGRLGGGRGHGFGLGAGGSRAPVPPPPGAPRAEQVASKARPPRLVYPKRNRDVEDGETFVARVTIDEDGYVVGAKLVRGFGGRRDDEAAGLIFKFRYAPALDDAGRPIRSTLDQNFLVE